jgi:GGDEF domain-containing protein
MDDFGSGYSSLGMLSTLPIDALKLDMQFIRNAFSERRDTSMLEIVFEIAEMLGVPTIAEGVETEEQMLTLKVMGCDIVQGYYFSRPLPADEFEPFLIKRIESKKAASKAHGSVGHLEHDSMLTGELAGRRIRDHYIYMAIHDPLTGLFNRSGFDVVFRDTDRNNVAILILRAEKKDEPDSPLSDSNLVRITEILQKYFRSVDRICRWKHDEFVVIMSRINSSMNSRILSKLGRMNEEAEDLVLTGGVAFSDPEDAKKDILFAAQEALEESLATERGGCIFK